MSDINANDNIVISKDLLAQNIPQDSLDKPIDALALKCVEWRWRFFKIDERNFIEISQKYPDQERKYIDNTGKWIECNIGDEWNKYCVSSKYYYCD